jgi:hypothetical protein
MAPRGTDAWHEAREFARATYAEIHQAAIKPDPDAFIIAAGPDAEGAPTVQGCAGCTYASQEPFFSERYLDTTAEQAIEKHTGAPVDRSRIVEIGALAGPGGAGQEMVRLIPIIAWCTGMEYILCTVTARLRHLLQQLDITLTVLGDADPERLDTGERASWGTYYDQLPQVGFIELRVLAPLFAGATGRYAFLEPVVELLAGTTTPQEVASRASR